MSLIDFFVCSFSRFITTFFGCKPKKQPFLVVTEKNN